MVVVTIRGHVHGQGQFITEPAGCVGRPREQSSVPTRLWSDSRAGPRIVASRPSVQAYHAIAILSAAQVIILCRGAGRQSVVGSCWARSGKFSLIVSIEVTPEADLRHRTAFKSEIVHGQLIGVLRCASDSRVRSWPGGCSSRENREPMWPQYGGRSPQVGGAGRRRSGTRCPKPRLLLLVHSNQVSGLCRARATKRASPSAALLAPAGAVSTCCVMGRHDHGDDVHAPISCAVLHMPRP